MSLTFFARIQIFLGTLACSREKCREGEQVGSTSPEIINLINLGRSKGIGFACSGTNTLETRWKPFESREADKNFTNDRNVYVI